jgi:hypothetical protein
VCVCVKGGGGGDYVDVLNKGRTDRYKACSQEPRTSRLKSRSYKTQPRLPRICGIKVLTAVIMKNTSLRDVTPCRLVERKPVFRVRLLLPSSE